MDAAGTVVKLGNEESSFDPEKFIDVRTAARLVFVSEVTIRRWLTQGRVRRFKVGGRTLLKIGDVFRMVRPA